MSRYSAIVTLGWEEWETVAGVDLAAGWIHRCPVCGTIDTSREGIHVQGPKPTMNTMKVARTSDTRQGETWQGETWQGENQGGETSSVSF